MSSKLNKCPVFLMISIFFVIAGCTSSYNTELASPDKKITVNFFLTESGAPQYQIFYKDSTVILPSTMGFEFKDQPVLNEGLKITAVSNNTFSETWVMPWGEQDSVLNAYSEMRISLKETTEPQRKINIVFRVFDDGVGFRYEFPEQPNMNEVLITDENTQFNLTGDHQVWWQPGDWDIYEHLYSATKFSEIDALAMRDDVNLAATYIPENAVNTPVTMKTADGVYLSFHEADLTDYAGITLKVDTAHNNMVSELVGSERLQGKAVISAPFNTPWRTIQIADRAGDLIESKMILNLNDPNIIGDVSYFTPMKYVGIWWEMHLGKSTWDMEGSQSMNTFTNSGETLT